MSTSIQAHIGRETFTTAIRTAEHTLVADEAKAAGGGGRGFTPHELLAAALGGCTNITLRMYADRKQWPLEAVDTQVEVEHGETFDTTHIKRTIRLTGPLSGEQRERLLQIAGRCPIHRTLAGQTDIRTELLPD
ncbi:MAG: OsmC family protein [Flavobacteriales bacterium]|nr:OsmC family protein [Flavobacteriales bacterium]